MIKLRNWKLIKETDSFVVEYNEKMGIYRVSYIEECHYVDEIIFDEIKSECTKSC